MKILNIKRIGADYICEYKDSGKLFSVNHPAKTNPMMKSGRIHLTHGIIYVKGYVYKINCITAFVLYSQSKD